MKRLALLVLAGSALVSGCVDDATVRVQTVPPPPPPQVTVSASVGADAPAPPTGQVEASAEAPAPPPAPEVEATDDPEEVTATTEPPDPLYEEPDEEPGPGYVWVGGYWGWTGGDWGWYPGHWLVAPAGRIYVAPYYERVNGQVVFVRGFWGPPGYAYRSYGGERISLVMAPRPAGWHRGYYDHYARMPGGRPGARPARFYAHAAAGPVRPLPRATAPNYRVAARGEAHEQVGGEARGVPQGRVGQPVGHETPGREPTAVRPTAMPQARAVGAVRSAPPARSAPAPRSTKKR